VFRAEVERVKREGATVLLSSHILSEVELLCDRVSIIRAGTIVESGTLSELRHLTGRDGPVRDYVLSRPGAMTFVDRYVQALEPVLEGYLREGKFYMTIAVGCTGGKHRSVAVSEQIATQLRGLGHRVSVQARDIGKE
jgi:ABC-type multidrug transport system ATPase subunit